MRSRRFRKRIQVWQIREVADGFGGYKTSEYQIGISWAEIKNFTPGGRNSQNLDIAELYTGNAIQIETRLRIDLPYNSINQFIVYKGERYKIATDPTNVDVNNSIVTFLAIRERPTSVGILPAQDTQYYNEYKAFVEADAGTITSPICVETFINDMLNRSFYLN